uniref:phospholipid-hydroperoxide glutathione peroxidase n=1 Tax=Paramormyrops kingsleyae TaxID=1676925 RepID=A0A3B3S9Z3_9TELE
QSAEAEDWRKATSIYDFSAKDIDGNLESLEKYRGYVCKTPVNYTQLAKMHDTYAEQGLRILGFPCNQFGKQEPGTEEEIKEFAKGYNANFDLFSKIDVNGENTRGKGIFFFIIKFSSTYIFRYSPMDDPVVVEKDLPKYL